MSDIEDVTLPNDLKQVRVGVYVSETRPQCIWFAASEYLDSIGVDPDVSTVSTVVDNVITMFEADGYSVTVIADA